MKQQNIPTEVKFDGFSPEMLDFLVALKENNSKGWFEEHKANYHKLVLQPIQAFVVALSGLMQEIDPEIDVTPTVDRTISRMYRDTRFAKDKSLYKDRVWITFKRRLPDWKDTPVYYFEITPDFYRYGMGYYSATKATMDQFRECLNTKPEEFLQVISFYTRSDNIFELEGEKYKRTLAPEKSELIQDWYQRKYFYLACNRFIDDLLFSRELVDEVKKGFRQLVPLYQFLWKLRGSDVQKA